MTSARQKADDFLKVASHFKLGSLPTEMQHSLTGDLADLARHNIPAALSLFHKIDSNLLEVLSQKIDSIKKLEEAIKETFAAGGRVFFYGCGATGRLSLSLEYLWRFMHKGDEKADHVYGFMSGGDLALVHSIENFEDHPEYGAQQVREAGFSENDLLISCTEGGETPSVIGATEEAARMSKRKPFFLYCNPDEALRAVAERSARVLDNDRIEKINLTVGPMALSGSTRLQASTILMLAAGMALFGYGSEELENFQKFWAGFSSDFLAPFIEQEAAFYQAGDYLLYETNIYGMTMLTDTTERSPTFSLRAFENQNDAARKPALAYFRFPHIEDAEKAWEEILLRQPRTIEWDILRAIAGHERLLGFDFSSEALAQRQSLVGVRRIHTFSIKREGNKMAFDFAGLHHEIDIKPLPSLFEHIFLKCLLNAHSTLVMGRLERYESNVMTWVKPSNKKLIDRAIRYVEHLLRHEGVAPPSYEDICHVLFKQAELMGPEDSIVLETVKAIKAL
ncbi:MAG: SIS domain-containing protein [Alphaproteobacteria bacterium]|nr:SIS domain-containing protein [Alphaproteobacteria bacterium]